MTKSSMRILLAALMIGISTANAGDMKSDAMEQKMAPAKNEMEMMQDETMKKAMKEDPMEANDAMKDEMMEKAPMASDKEMMHKPMAKKSM